MRLSAFHTAAILSAGAMFLSACSGAAQSGSAGLPQTGVTPRHMHSATGSFLYVTDYAKNSVEVLQHLDQVWSNVGSIKESVAQPLNDWVDQNQNLYVANGNGPVTEYDSSGKLIFTYGAAGPARGVTTDRAGNVYAAGVDVSEYPQGVDDPASCEIPKVEPRSIAVDKDGDVFVGLFLHTGRGRVAEYVHGLLDSRCRATRLPIKFRVPVYGIAIDKEGNLLVTDSAGRGVSVIDVIAPPYTSITRTLQAGLTWAASVSINQDNTRVYVSQSSDIAILDYPAGARIATLGSGQNLTQPTSAAGSDNFVP